jgi:hypothetical protein
VNGQWKNTSTPSKSVAIAKDGLSVEVSTDGNVYYKRPGKPYVKFEGATNYIRHISASTTKLACTSTDNKTWTKDITSPPAVAPAVPGTPLVPTPPLPPGTGVTMSGIPEPVPAAPSSAQPVLVLPESAGPGTFLLQPTS